MLSEKVALFTESVIRGMTRECEKYGGVNLAQGFPDFDPPEEMMEAACDAIKRGCNQYATTWGTKSIRDAISKKVKEYNGIVADPETDITVTCGATEAMIASLMAVTNPGDEVIIFEPFYENYGPDSIISGATPKFVPLREPDFHFDPDELKRAFSDKTKAIIINTPNNPTGKVFSKEELRFIADLCIKFNSIAITDEIYEHIIYDGSEHSSIATLDGMAEGTITINGLSKTYSVTGWRIGYIIAQPKITSAIRKMHDFLTIGAAHPLQEAGAVALNFPDSYYQWLQSMYQVKRDLLLKGLEAVGFKCYKPKGAYYIMCAIDGFGHQDDVEFANYLVRDIGVATVPGSSFYSRKSLGRNKIRFTFCKKDETLKEAVANLSMLAHSKASGE